MKKTYGLQYQKFDLHVHTPASDDFNDKAVDAEALVKKAIAENLRGIAITDHNSGEWIDEVKTAAEGTNLIVFPGVEVPVIGGKNGLHVIGIFDIDKTRKILKISLAW